MLTVERFTVERFTVAGRYQQQEKIADGGSGTVFRARDLKTGEVLALKCFHVHRAFDTALLPALREAQELAARLGPKVLVALLDVGNDSDGTPYLTMPLLRGETLRERMTRPYPVAERGQILAALEEAIAALQEAGFTHGDVSPENIFVLAEGGVVLLDLESLGRIGTPRPSRHTEGMPALPSGVRDREDDVRALTQLRQKLKPAFAARDSIVWSSSLVVVGLVASGILWWLLGR